jgi:hypothetical protein
MPEGVPAYTLPSRVARSVQTFFPTMPSSEV